MKKSLMVKYDLYKQIAEQIATADHKILMVWACDCVDRVLKNFEIKYPKDKRPRSAILAGRAWAKTGIFKMADVRLVSLASHAAAREVISDDVARSVARAAGQALATAHVKTHSIEAAIYAATAIRDLTDEKKAEAAVLKERDWQYQHLLNLINK